MLFSLVLVAVRADDAAADATSGGGGGGSDSSLQAELEQLKSKVSVLGLFRLILCLFVLILSVVRLCDLWGYAGSEWLVRLWVLDPYLRRWCVSAE